MARSKQTICWRCENAVPNLEQTRGCSWSIGFEPVAGWNAQEVVKKNNSFGEDRHMHTYKVLDCPKFTRG